MHIFSRLFQPRADTFLVFVLAALQVTHVLDFVVLMPLGPQLMRELALDTQAFGMVVSAYTFSAGIFGFFGAFFLDRFDRKQTLIALYGGFLLGTVMCAVAPNYTVLMVARVVSGAFGGLLTATVFSVIGDAFPEAKRGRVTGAVMASFSIASVLGIPLGLYLAHMYSWRAPFVMVFILSVIVLLFLFRFPSVRGHLTHYVPVSPIALVMRTVMDRQQVVALAFSGVITLSAFMVIPFLTPLFVGNFSFPESLLGLVYLIGGGVTFFSSRWIGLLSDRHGKRKLFILVALLSIIPIFLVTHMVTASIWAVFMVSALFMALVSGRFVPVVAMLTAAVPPEQRGSFMAFNSCIQQLAAGLAAILSGMVLHMTDAGQLLHFGWLGMIAIALTLLAVLMVMAMRVKA